MSNVFINRTIQPVIERAIGHEYIVGLIGARQVGKSTLLARLLPQARTLHINFDSSELRDKTLHDETFLLKELEKLNGGPLSKEVSNTQEALYLCVDEAQKLPEAFEIIKQLHDTYAPALKIVLSGSSSLLIKKHSAETLAGRIRFFTLHPFTLHETARFRGLVEADDRMATLQSLVAGEFTHEAGLDASAAKRYLEEPIAHLTEECCLWGLLPSRMHLGDPDEWILLLRDYIDTYIDRDMRATERIGSLRDYKNIVRLMGDAVGNLVNFTQYGSDLGIHRTTVKEYLSILDESLLGYRLQAFARSARVRATKAEKSYILDNGLAYYFMNLPPLNVLNASGQMGALYENLVISEFKKLAAINAAPLELRYWRQSGSQSLEVDLVTEHRGTVVPVEIKTKQKLTPKDLKGIRKFLEVHTPKDGLHIPYGVVIYRGAYQYLESERIFLIPNWLWI